VCDRLLRAVLRPSRPAFELTLVGVGVATALAGLAQAQSVSRLGNVNFAVDGDGVHVENVDLGGHYPFGAYMERAGVPMQAPTLASIATCEAGSAMGLWREEPDATTGVAGETSVVEAARRVRTVGDLAWRFHPSRGTRVELLAAGDLVASDDGLARGIAYGFVGSSVAREVVDHVTAEALAGVQSFTDGNARLQLRAGVVWEALPSHGDAAGNASRQIGATFIHAF
jgi:hypothetical protein